MEFTFFDTTTLEFWVTWLLILGFCVIQTLRASSTQMGVLGLLPALCLMFGYFFVLQAAVVTLNLYNLIPSWMLAAGQVLALACLVGTVAGWNWGLRFVPPGAPSPQHSYNYMLLWWMGVGATLVGIAGYTSYSYRLSADEARVSSSYWIMLYHLGYPGILLCMQVMGRRSEYRNPWTVLVVVVLTGVLMYPFILSVRRGPMFPMFVVLVYGYYLACGRRVNRGLVLGGLAGVGLLMLLFVTIRDYSSGTGSWRAEQLERVDADTLLINKSRQQGDNEFFYHCGATGVIYELDRFQWGTGYLCLGLNAIPRSWWPEKPTLGEGLFEPMTPEEMAGILGWRMTPGASAGGVCESYAQFGWVTPLFWVGIGWVFGYVYAWGRRTGDLLYQSYYVGMLAASHWLVSQGFSAAFVPMTIYVAIPWVAYQVARRPVPASRVAAKLPTNRRLPVGA